MAPVVLESPPVSVHSAALTSMSRLQFNGHIHTPPASDHSRNDDASPLAAPSPLPPSQGRNAPSPFPLDPALKDRSGDSADPATDQNSPPANSELACTNCGTVTTPQWRRGDDGKSICNACGQYHTRSHSLHRVVTADSGLLLFISRLPLGGRDDLPPAPRVLRVRHPSFGGNHIDSSLHLCLGCMFRVRRADMAPRRHHAAFRVISRRVQLFLSRAWDAPAPSSGPLPIAALSCDEPALVLMACRSP